MKRIIAMVAFAVAFIMLLAAIWTDETWKTLITAAAFAFLGSVMAAWDEQG